MSPASIVKTITKRAGNMIYQQQITCNKCKGQGKYADESKGQRIRVKQHN